MPKLKTEEFGPGDLSWIGPDSAKAGRTEWLDTGDAAFTSAVVRGVIPSGTALALVDGQLKPYDDGGEDGAEILIGFLYADQPVGVGKLGVAVFDQGRVNTKNLPDSGFTIPDPEADATGIVFMKGA